MCHCQSWVWSWKKCFWTIKNKNQILISQSRGNTKFIFLCSLWKIFSKYSHMKKQPRSVLPKMLGENYQTSLWWVNNKHYFSRCCDVCAICQLFRIFNLLHFSDSKIFTSIPNFVFLISKDQPPSMDPPCPLSAPFFTRWLPPPLSLPCPALTCCWFNDCLCG